MHRKYNIRNLINLFIYSKRKYKDSVLITLKTILLFNIYFYLLNII